MRVGSAVTSKNVECQPCFDRLGTNIPRANNVWCKKPCCCHRVSERSRRSRFPTQYLSRPEKVGLASYVKSIARSGEPRRRPATKRSNLKETPTAIFLVHLRGAETGNRYRELTLYQTWCPCAGWSTAAHYDGRVTSSVKEREVIAGPRIKCCPLFDTELPESRRLFWSTSQVVRASSSTFISL